MDVGVEIPFLSISSIPSSTVFLVSVSFRSCSSWDGLDVPHSEDVVIV